MILRRTSPSRIHNSLYEAFDAEPLEDGVSHPAEGILSDLVSGDEQAPFEWLKDICLEYHSADLSSSILRCLGRLTKPGTASWRLDLIRDGLAVENVEIRDAAIQTAELWAEPGIREVLEEHREPVSWLSGYLQDVLDDLAE